MLADGKRGVHDLLVGPGLRPLARRTMAEVGVFQGVSAKLICEAKGDKTLHLFDTFGGLPAASAADGPVHLREKEYDTSIERVQEFLQGYANVDFHKGFFPDSAAGLQEPTYCSSTPRRLVREHEGLPRIILIPAPFPGGILISHDYSILAGVKQAFTEFLADKRERLIEVPTTSA